METKVFLAVVILAACAVGNTIREEESFSHLFDGVPRAPIFIVTVEGKSFFLERLTANWTQSLDYCEGKGLQAASINTMNQFTALNQSYTANFNGYFWTSGRDALTLEQFSWDANDENIHADLPFEQPPELRNCVAFLSTSTGSSLVSRLCTSTAYSLCQTA